VSDLGADLTTRVGSVVLPNPVMTASGTAGHGAELGAYVDLASLGAVVVKSLSAEAWAGNPPLRVTETGVGMLNSVGLQGPGVAAWLAEDLPPLLRAGARVVASIWGRSVEDYARASELLARAPAEVVAVEVNLSCPNTEAGRDLFAHSAGATAAVVAATDACDRPRWAKLSPNVTDLVPIATAARDAGAEAVTLINTVMGQAIDPETGAYRLGSGPRGGGLSGAGIHPIAVRAVHDVHAALPDLPIVGVGGIVTGEDAAELVLAGASAVQVGTATFADPRAPARVLEQLSAWARRTRRPSLSASVGAAHRAARVIGALGASYLNFHAQGGVSMLTAGVDGFLAGASEAGLPAPTPLAVTILTSDGDAPPHILGKRVQAALEAGCGGIVCAASDVREAKQLGPRLVAVVPGIRPEGADVHDQARSATPQAAIDNGADLLVLGRAVTRAPDPAAAAAAIAASLRG
jgi:dihydroorotate dehydrogenase (NAD+) catalytic subunit